MGMRTVHAGNKSKEIRLKRYDTALNVLKIAKSRAVDFVIIAGDIFENNNIDEIVVRKTVDILNQFAPIPVFIIPGNHDPSLPGGIWERGSWKRIEPHVIMLDEAGEYPFDNGVTLYPCPVKQKRSNLDPTNWIPKRDVDDKRIRIGLAHGSLDVLPDSINFPIAKNCADEKGLDYLALGDWHSYYQLDRTIYSGTFEPTSFDEPDSGNIVIVEISQGIPPKIEKIKSRSLNWAMISINIRDISDLEKFEEMIRTLGPLNTLVLRIKIQLLLSEDDDFNRKIEVIRGDLEEGAFYVEWDQIEEIPLKDNLMLKMPDGILQDIDSALLSILEGKIPQPPCNAYANLDPLVVRKARILLHTLYRRGVRDH